MHRSDFDKKTYHDQDPAFDKHPSVWVHSIALKNDLNPLSIYGAGYR